MPKRDMIRTNYYFPKVMLSRLRDAQQKTGLHMSELLRRALDEFLVKMGL